MSAFSKLLGIVVLIIIVESITAIAVSIFGANGIWFAIPLALIVTPIICWFLDK